MFLKTITNFPKNIHKKRTFAFFCLLPLIILSFLTFPKLTSADFNSGDSLFWESGEGSVIAGFIQVTLNFTTSDGDPLVDYQKFDIGGNPTSVIAYNNTMINFWLSMSDISQLLMDGASVENISVINEEISCVILERSSGSLDTKIYYDQSTGVMVLTEDTNEGFIRLISWENMDLKAYIDEISMGISGFSYSIVGICFVTIFILMKFKTKQR
jgi:hypothetical protein